MVHHYYSVLGGFFNWIMFLCKYICRKNMTTYFWICQKLCQSLLARFFCMRVYVCSCTRLAIFTHRTHRTRWGCLMLTGWQVGSDGVGHFPGRSGHTMRDSVCVSVCVRVWVCVSVCVFFFPPALVTRHYQTAHSPPNTPQAHEDDHIWYTDDILSLLWQHGLIFLLRHPLLCGCYSSQIYHFNGEVVRPEDYLRDKYIIVCSSCIDRMS